MTPCCQLLAESYGKTEEIPTMKHQVSLNGAKYPHDVFVINLPTGGIYTCSYLYAVDVILFLHYSYVLQISNVKRGHRHLET